MPLAKDHSGSWVTRHLAFTYESSYKIVCFDALDAVASLKNIAGLQSNANFHFVKGDITCKDDVKAALETHNVDCVLHFAAFSHVQDSFEDPIGFCQNNVIGTLVVLDAIREYGMIRRLVHVSTDEVYGQTEGAAVDESHLLKPTNPYSASKAAAEMLVAAYQSSYGIPAIIVRSNNVYGPYQYPQSKSS
ncbi:MAG: hypothetical protein LQ349_003888 [Xanthoria aureola]|nr:MAG: hypothetical protein LQ349_003888 [Xanthoria aureola]